MKILNNYVGMIQTPLYKDTRNKGYQLLDSRQRFFITYFLFMRASKKRQHSDVTTLDTGNPYGGPQRHWQFPQHCHRVSSIPRLSQKKKIIWQCRSADYLNLAQLHRMRWGE